jgi:hypothetical protein
MNLRIKELADLCITHFLPNTLTRTVGKEIQLYSVLPYDYIVSKTAGIIVEGKVYDRETYKLREEVLCLTEEELLNASLGFELVKESVFNDLCS